MKKRDFEIAKSYFDNEKYHLAIETCDRIIKENKGIANVWGLKGSAEYMLKRSRSSKESFERALNIDPEYEEVRYNLAITLADLGEYVKSLEQYNICLEINKDNTKAALNKSILLHRYLNDQKSAIEILDEILSKDENNESALLNKAMVLLNNNELQASLELVDKYLERRPEDYEVISLKGTILMDLDDPNAEKLLNLAKEKGALRALFDKGVYYYSKEDFENAISYFKTAIEKGLRESVVSTYLGSAFGNLEKYDDALEVFTEALERDPENSDLLYNKGLTYSFLGEPEKTIEFFGKVDDAGVNRNNLKIHLGIALSEIGKINEGINCFKEVLRDDEDNLPANYNLARAYKEINIEYKAIEHFKKANNSLQDDVDILLEIAQLYYDVGNLEIAYSYLKKAGTIDRDNLYAKYLKAKILVDWENYKRATKYLDEILANDPNYIQAYIQRSMIYALESDFKKATEFIDEAPKSIKSNATICIMKGYLDIFLYGEASRKKALKKKAKKYYNSALKSINGVLVKDNRCAKAFEAKAFIHQRKGQFSFANDYYLHALRADETNDDIKIDYGKFLYELGDIPSLISVIGEVSGINRNSGLLELKGKVAIENHNYRLAYSHFVEAIKYDKSNLALQMWKSYASYLTIEYSKKDKKSYDEEINCILRNLERVEELIDNTCDLGNNKKDQKALKSYVLYMLGFFYYKTQDYISAKENLLECLKSNSDKSVKRNATHLLGYIWEYKIKPPWWRWWFAAPVYKWPKRAIFFGIIATTFVGFMHLIFDKIPIFNYDLGLVQLPTLSFILVMLLVLFAPNLKYLKIKDFEAELMSPINFSNVFTMRNMERYIQKTGAIDIPMRRGYDLDNSRSAKFSLSMFGFFYR
ncbi:MAG: tetratricopeptide repeat protein [Bacteroidales bacterium]|nr:tetratricopeptide repeat protein [Bacteroidales bacterium]MCF8327838.1 tetratricopeptide repeat protein [Bacteroidales bacterium]